jgi:hypothetical protein
VGDIAKAVVDCPNEDFVVECVGVLGNMTLPDLDFCQLMQRFNLIPWVQNILVPGKTFYKVLGMMAVAEVKVNLYLTLNLHALHFWSPTCKASHTDVPETGCSCGNIGEA